MLMRFIIAYRLKRKNARRKVYTKLECKDQYEALQQFNAYCEMRMRVDEKPKQWELLTGDWKHITYYEGGDPDEQCKGKHIQRL